MNVQAMPPISASANNTSVAGRPPMLGTPVPGTAGGLPAQGGLSIAKNPMAEQLRSYGRNGDSMLVHMTPGEVGGLQQLAMAAGGSLTINPDTGLPEAGFLGKLLPTILGAALAATGVGAPLAAGIVGLGQTALTGDIGKGLMAGLGAFGGGSLAGAAGLGGAISNNAFGALGSKAGILGANMGAGAGAGALGAGKAAASNLLPGDEIAMRLAEAKTQAASNLLPGDMLAEQLASQATSLPIPGDMLAEQLASQAAPAAGGLGVTAPAAKTGLAGFGQRFGQTASAGLGKGMAAKYAPYAAGLGLLNAASEASTPTVRMPEAEEYEFPLENYQPLNLNYRPRELTPGGEIQFFDVVNPVPPPPVPRKKVGQRFAEGGEAEATGVNNIPIDPQMSQMLADYTRMFSTSPGAITAASGYPARTRTSVGEIDFNLQGPTDASTGTPGAPNVPGSGGETTGTPANVSDSNTMNAANTQNSVSNTQFDINRRDGVYSPDPRGPYVLNPSLPGTNLDAVKVSGQGVMPDFKLEDLRINPVNMPFNGTYSPLSPGTTIPGMEVSGDGIMPNFTLDSLKVDPVIIPRTNISSGYGASGSMGNYRGEFGGSSPFSNTGGNLNSMSSFGNNLDSRISGGNYTLPPLTFTPPFTLPPLTFPGSVGGGNLPTDPEEYEEAKARGGLVNMKDGSFVVDARTVSELGNGSSNAGIEHLARMGGRPVRGAGDGVSDSVPARIGGRQKARVARDEVIFSPEAVSRLGAGNHSKGTKKLYALMGKAHSARKKAGRGQDTKVAKGLGALR